MALLAWQTALAEVLIARSSRLEPDAGLLADPALSRAEREWLMALPAAPGFEVTCDVQRWWRHFRVQSAAPLTLSALGPERRRTVLNEFVESCARPSSFFVREALRFLEFLVERPHGVPHLAEVAAFERAMLVLSESVALGAPTPPSVDLPSAVVRHPLASVVAFNAPPEEVIGALVAGREPPAEGTCPHWLLVAPNLPNLARRASALEAWVFEEARAPVRPFKHEAVFSLWRSGALVAAA